MWSTVLVGIIFAIILGALIAGAVVLRRRQRALRGRQEAGHLQRRAAHLRKVALAVQTHTSNSAIARTLLEEAVRILERANQLGTDAELTRDQHQCYEAIVAIETEPQPTAAGGDTRGPATDLPEAELLEAQMHMIEATRLLIGLEKHGRISYSMHSEMTTAIKQAQRALDLRLQLRRATRTLDEEHRLPKPEVTIKARAQLP